MKIKRDSYLRDIIEKKENGRVKIITGIRRCGKSYLLFTLYKEYLLSCGIEEDQIITIALDEFENIEYRNPFMLNDYIKKRIEDKNRMYYVFIDEIQLSEAVCNPYIDNKEKKITFVDVLIGLMKNKNIDIYVTGSNSKMLSYDVLTQFRDRGDEIHVRPLSFSEICNLYDNTQIALEHYYIYGGMPHVYSLQSEEQKSKYLKDLFRETYIKDILVRNKIHNDEQIINVLLDFSSSAIGSLTNPTKLSKRFLSEMQIKISPSTISKYLSYFEQSYLIYHANRYDVKGSRYFSTPLKYYFSDIGLRNARLNFRQIEKSHIMENIIYNELLSRGYNVDVGVVEYDLKKDNIRKKVQLEVDFVINKGHQRYYIQSALDIDSSITEPLRRIKDSFKKVVIIERNIIPRHDDYGILYIGLEDFLLNEHSLDL